MEDDLDPMVPVDDESEDEDGMGKVKDPEEEGDEELEGVEGEF